MNATLKNAKEIFVLIEDSRLKRIATDFNFLGFEVSRT